MSESEARKPGLELRSFEALEGAVGRALRQLEIWRERAIASETERRRLQEELDRISASRDDGADPSEVAAELEELREQNASLKRRIAQGRRQAEKLAREVEFLEDTR
jgi:hypothetical protein